MDDEVVYGPLTLGHLRAITKDLPDETHISPDWNDYCPSDDFDPVIGFTGIALRKYDDNNEVYLSVGVKCSPLSEMTADEDEDEETHIESRHKCPTCGHTWTYIWDCACDDDCEKCQTKDIAALQHRNMAEREWTSNENVAWIAVGGEVNDE